MGVTLLLEGILPNKKYYGIVDFYDPEFSLLEGRGRIKAYIGGDKFKLLEVFEKGIDFCSDSSGKKILYENEIVQFRIIVGKYGLTATEVSSFMKADPSNVDVEGLIIRLYNNGLSDKNYCPIGPSLPLLGGIKEESLPKIIKFSKERTNEQKI